MKRCFIIGNGPSQNNVDLSRLEGEVTFGMNDITLLDFSPTYWVVLDQHVWNNYKKEILDFNSHSSIVMGIGKRDEPRYERVEVYGDMRALQESKVSFWGDKDRIYSVGNVGYSCMQIAWRKGFRILNLIGFDAGEPRPKLKDHYSPDYGSRLDDPNDRARGYSIPSNVWRDAYWLAYRWITERGGEVWDISNSPLNIFPRRSLDEALV